MWKALFSGGINKGVALFHRFHPNHSNSRDAGGNSAYLLGAIALVNLKLHFYHSFH